MTASELEDTANTSTEANCGWASPSSSSTGFETTLSARLMSKKGAAEGMAAIKLGRSTIDVAITTSEVKEIADEAKEAVTDEAILKTGRTGKLNSTTVWFRQEGLFVTVSYREFGLPPAQSDAKDMVTERAEGFARSLDTFSGMSRRTTRNRSGAEPSRRPTMRRTGTGQSVSQVVDTKATGGAGEEIAPPGPAVDMLAASEEKCGLPAPATGRGVDGEDHRARHEPPHERRAR
ncbi:hypothetical protein [Streptomyces pristinaespiralis]|uniref:hypothetical protein n=1 Tax=Streptomyces pristinaespiralis TaxID=38300 RepID=UPI003400CFD0